MARWLYDITGLTPFTNYRVDTASATTTPATITGLGGNTITGSTLQADPAGRIAKFTATTDELYAKPLDYRGTYVSGVTTITSTTNLDAPSPQVSDGAVNASSFGANTRKQVEAGGLYAGARTPLLTSVMASPPTIALGVANAATTISGGTDRSAVALVTAGARFTGTRTVAVDSSLTGGYQGVLTSRDITTQFPPKQFQVEFDTDADVIELVWQAVTTSVAGYRVWVDGVPAQAPVTSMGVGGAIYRTKVTFSGRGVRRIRFEAVWARLIGVTCHPTVSIQPPARRVDPVCVVIGDSFTEGTGGTWAWTGWPSWMGETLGWDVHQLGVGTTGYVNDGGVTGKTAFYGRLGDVHPGARVIVVSGGYNDDATPTLVAPAARTLFGALQSGWPDAKIIVTSNWTNSGVTSTAARTVVRDALATEAARARLQFIDAVGYPTTTSWITGTGKVGTTAGNGNADYYVSTDGVHPSAAGHEYLGRAVAAAILAANT